MYPRSTVRCGEQAEIEDEERELREEYRGNESDLGRVIKLKMLQNSLAVASQHVLRFEVPETLEGIKAMYAFLSSTSIYLYGLLVYYTSYRR